MEILSTPVFTFYGTEFPSYLCDDNRVYLPLAKICKAIGLNPLAQRKRIQSDETIHDALVMLEVKDVDPETGNFRSTKTACLLLNRLPYWLGTIDASRVKPEIKDRLILYKKQLADATWAVFHKDMMPNHVLC